MTPLIDETNFFVFWLSLALVLLSLAVAARFRRTPAPRPLGRGIDKASVGIAAGATLALTVFAVATAAWGFSDDDIFLLYYVRGQPYPPPIWPESARFFPLGHQEWRLLYGWTADVRVYYAAAAAQYGAYAAGIVLLLGNLNQQSRLALVLLLTLPPVLVAFTNIAMPERTQVMLLPWFLLFLLRWDTTRSAEYALLAITSAHVMLYLKEPTVLFIAAVAGMRLADTIGRAAKPQGGRAAIASVSREGAADVGLLVACALFLTLYFTAIAPASLFEAERVYDRRALATTNVIPTLEAWARTEPLLVVVLAAGLATVGSRAARRQRLGLGDQAIVGAGVYFAALVAASLVSTFYAALPLAAATIGLIAAIPFDKLRVKQRLATALATAAIAASLLLATPHALYKLDWLARNEGLATRIGDVLGDAAGKRVFLSGHSWDAETFAVYAKAHRGLAVTFLYADARYARDEEEGTRCSASPSACLAYAPDAGDSDLLVDLGRLESRRSGEISRGGELVWHYDEQLLRRLLEITPAPLRGVVRRAYNFW